MKKITLFSDGSALGNPGPGGYGVILRFGGKEKELSGAHEHTTNGASRCHRGFTCSQRAL